MNTHFTPIILAAALCACPVVNRDPPVARPPSGCTAGGTMCRDGAPWRCSDNEWSQADRQCNRLADAGSVVCCLTPSGVRPDVLLHACVPQTDCREETAR